MKAYDFFTDKIYPRVLVDTSLAMTQFGMQYVN